MIRPRFILSAESSFYTQSVVRGPWSVVLGPWSVVRGPWSVVRGPWSVVRSPQSAGFFTDLLHNINR